MSQITLLDVEQKLAELREEWPGKLGKDREILKRRARAYEIIKERLMKKGNV